MYLKIFIVYNFSSLAKSKIYYLKCNVFVDVYFYIGQCK